MNKTDDFFSLAAKTPLLRQRLSATYHQASKYRLSDNKMRAKKWQKEWSKFYYKGYPRFPGYALPTPTIIPSSTISLYSTLTARKSSKHFSQEKISIQQLSDLLYFTAGEYDGYIDTEKLKKRFYPSAGARYPLEVYPVIIKNSDLPNGVYHYYVRNHGIESLWKRSISKKFLATSIGQPVVQEAAFLLVITGVFDRTQIKYLERGYRFILMETGHMSQNAYLAAIALGLGCCSVGGFIDDDVNDLVGIDGITESVLIVLAFGAL